MDKKTFLEKLTEAGTCEDDVQKRTILAELNTEATSLFDSNEVLSTEKKDFEEKQKQYETDMETLRQANMKMFLRLGSEKDEKEKQKDNTGIKDDSSEEKRKVADLFDDKGGLKL